MGCASTCTWFITDLADDRDLTTGGVAYVVPAQDEPAPPRRVTTGPTVPATVTYCPAANDSSSPAPPGPPSGR